MQWQDIRFDPPKRTLRQFAALWLLFFGALAVWHGWFRDRLALGSLFAVLAAAGGLLGLVRPQALRRVYVGWMIAVFPIGWIISRAVLAAIYYGMMTPLAVLFRLAGRDALRLRRQSEVATYWLPKPAPRDASSYFKQY